jgi:hypothetical protein
MKSRVTSELLQRVCGICGGEVLVSIVTAADLVVEVAHPPVNYFEGAGGDVHGVDGCISDPVNLQSKQKVVDKNRI